VTTSIARVMTDHPRAYLRQLCEHFADPAHRHSGQEFQVSFDDQEGLIDFAPVVSGTCRLDARQGGVLVVEASGRTRPRVSASSGSSRGISNASDRATG
jgi:hypothetical protein